VKTVFRALIACATALILAFSATPASAHSELEASTPAQGATVSHLDEFTLTFGEEVVPEFSKYTLVDSMGMVVTLGTPKYDVTKTTVTVPVTGELMAGTYAIGYAILSIDGHPISGKVTFTSTAVAPTPTPSPTHTTTPAPTPDDGPNLLTNLGYVIGGFLVGLAIIGVIVLLVRRRRKN
jgi:methionine-rich copper-binding protein CopC